MPRIDETKKKLRKLKRLEATIRFGGNVPPNASLVFERLFDLRDIPTGRAKYSLYMLAAMDHAAYLAAVEEFFSHVYYAYYMENGLFAQGHYDPALLARLDLPYDADTNAIKARFRQLAKIHHPDAGGNPEDFIRLMSVYRALISK